MKSKDRQTNCVKGVILNVYFCYLFLELRSLLHFIENHLRIMF